MTSMDKDVITCLGTHRSTDVYEFLNKSEGNLHLKFDKIKFDGDSSFWTKNGPRIQSIIFEDCQFLNGYLEKIIISCQNLLKLSFLCLNPTQINMKPITELTERASKNKIVREKLNSLQIHINSQRSMLSDRTISQLLSMFPKVKILKINVSLSFQFDTNNWKKSNSSESAYKDCIIVPILNYLKASVDRMEKLELHFPDSKIPPKFVRTILDTLAAMKRLTELSMNLSWIEQPEDVEKLLYSKSLKSLAFVSQRTSVIPFLEKLLHFNSSLEHLEISGTGDLYLNVTKYFWEKLLSSGLKSCKINAKRTDLEYQLESCDSSFIVPDRPTTSPSLSLYLSTEQLYCSNPLRQVAFLQQCFQYLQHLQLDNVSVSQFKLLLQHQTNLKSLVLKNMLLNVNEQEADVFKDVFNKFTAIEHMELGSSGGYVFLKSLSPDSKLRNLKYLNINLTSYKDADKVLSADLLKLAKATPSLEGLFLHTCKSGIFDVKKLCDQLKKLRYLHLDREFLINDAPGTDAHCRKLFWSKEMRVVVMSCQLYSKYKAIYSKSMSESIEDKKEAHSNIFLNYTFAEPEIGGYTVDWLKY